MVGSCHAYRDAAGKDMTYGKTPTLCFYVKEMVLFATVLRWSALVLLKPNVLVPRPSIYETLIRSRHGFLPLS